MDPDQSSNNIAVAEKATSLLEAHVFVPIDLNWRKKYYRTSLTRRFKALLLDHILTFIPTFLVLSIIFGIVGVDLNNDLILLYCWVSIFFSMILYSAIMESSRYRGTFGKATMKIQITDRDGYPVSFHRSLWRNILRIGVFYSYFFIIPFIIQIFRFRKTKKLFHDELTRTLIGDLITNVNPRVPESGLKTKIPLNKKLIFQLSLFEIPFAIADLFGISERLLGLAGMLLYISFAYLIAKKCSGKYVQNAFYSVLLGSIWRIIILLVFFKTYASDSAKIDALLFEVDSSPRIFLILNEIVEAIFAGLLLAYFTFIATEIMKKKKNI